jgi:hypothetical protein
MVTLITMCLISSNYTPSYNWRRDIALHWNKASNENLKVLMCGFITMITDLLNARRNNHTKQGEHTNSNKHRYLIRVHFI